MWPWNIFRSSMIVENKRMEDSVPDYIQVQIVAQNSNFNYSSRYADRHKSNVPTK